MRKVLIVDTSILCVYLAIPGKEICGSGNDKWDQKRVADRFEAEEKQGTKFILPLATIIETGNHISQANSRRYETARAFADILVKVADGIIPWEIFTTQVEELEVRIYIEGGGDSKSTKALIREGFSQFLKPLVEIARSKNIR